MPVKLDTIQGVFVQSVFYACRNIFLATSFADKCENLRMCRAAVLKPHARLSLELTAIMRTRTALFQLNCMQLPVVNTDHASYVLAKRARALETRQFREERRSLRKLRQSNANAVSRHDEMTKP